MLSASQCVDDGELVVPPGPLRGRKALRERGVQIVQSPAWRTIRHVCGNMRFVTESPDEAASPPLTRTRSKTRCSDLTA